MHIEYFIIIILAYIHFSQNHTIFLIRIQIFQCFSLEFWKEMTIVVPFFLIYLWRYYFDFFFKVCLMLKKKNVYIVKPPAELGS